MPLDFDTHVISESEAFLAAIMTAGPDAIVPSCPGWNASDLLWHLATVQHFWAVDVAGRHESMDHHLDPDRPGSFDAELNFFRAASNDLSTALAEADDGEQVWTWFEAEQNIAFVRRRQAHEALIHRIDAELAAGELTPIDAELATDGVLEAIEWQFGGAPSWATVAEGGPVGRVATTDTDADWLVQVRSWSGTCPNTGNTHADEPVLAVMTDGASSFEISGPAVDLDLWMWNRGPLDPLTATGDITPFAAVIHAGVD